MNYPSATWDECGGEPVACDWPVAVVCGPGGPFVDYGKDFYNPLGWTVQSVPLGDQGFAAVLNAC